MQILDSANKPISEAEVRIIAFENQARYEVFLDNKTDSNGIVQFNILEKFKKNTQKFEVEWEKLSTEEIDLIILPKCL